MWTAWEGLLIECVLSDETSDSQECEVMAHSQTRARVRFMNRPVGITIMEKVSFGSEVEMQLGSQRMFQILII